MILFKKQAGVDVFRAKNSHSLAAAGVDDTYVR